jgi:hypothetical protein
MKRAADGFSALPTTLRAFVFGQVVVQPGEAVEAPAAHWATELGFFVVVVAGHWGGGCLRLQIVTSNRMITFFGADLAWRRPLRR